MDPTSPDGLDNLAADRYARLYHERYGLILSDENM